jgi:hypothetical protein
LSSQTTDTPGTTQTKHSGSLRSNFSNLPDLKKLCKSTFPRPALPKTAPTHNPARHQANHFQAVCQGIGRNLSASAAATQKTIHPHTPPRKSTPTPPPHPQKPPNHKDFEGPDTQKTTQQPAPRNYALPHTARRWQSQPIAPPRDWKRTQRSDGAVSVATLGLLVVRRRRS